MTFKELFYITIKHIYIYRFQLSKALLFPFILTVLLAVVSLTWSNIYLSIIYSILSLMLQTIFAITTHRMILLGPSHVPEWGIIKWSHRETVFIFHVLALSFIFFLFPQVAIIFIILFILSIVLLIPRISLVFPAIAIGDSCSFKNSWFFTKNYQKLMFFSTILIPLVVSIPGLLLRNIPYTFLIVSILTNVTTVIGISSLSLSYKYILKVIEKDS